MAHYIENNPEPSTPTGKDPSPNSENEFGEGSSLAVLQFVALTRKEWTVHAPTSPFRVERVTAEERYCLGCGGVRVHDLVEGQRSAISGQLLAGGFSLAGTRQRLVICRCCGKERRYEK